MNFRNLFWFCLFLFIAGKESGFLCSVFLEELFVEVVLVFEYHNYVLSEYDKVVIWVGQKINLGACIFMIKCSVKFSKLYQDDSRVHSSLTVYCKH